MEMPPLLPPGSGHFSPCWKSACSPSATASGARTVEAPNIFLIHSPPPTFVHASPPSSHRRSADFTFDLPPPSKKSPTAQVSGGVRGSVPPGAALALWQEARDTIDARGRTLLEHIGLAAWEQSKRPFLIPMKMEEEPSPKREEETLANLWVAKREEMGTAFGVLGTAMKREEI